MSYILEYKYKGESVKKYIDDAELADNRKAYLNIQNDVKQPILFCNCCDKNIPMSLTKHEPTPHFQTKLSEDRGKHYIFCRHYIGKDKKNTYLPAIRINDDGTEIAYIDWEKNDEELDRQIIDGEYRKRNTFKSNNCNRVIQGKMTFDAFVKYKNMQYFKVNQYTNQVVNLTEFNKKLFGWIGNSYIGRDKVKNLTKGTFVYGIVDKIEEVNIQRYKIKTEAYNIPCKKEIFDKAVHKFRRTYNNLDLFKMLGNDEVHVVCYGIKDTSLKYPTCKYLGFMLINKYGLYCESLNEVKMFNLICDCILQTNLKENYVFYKPTEPENDYLNPNYISDGAICKRGEKEKIVVEVFGRQEQEYINRKNDKMSTCKYEGIFWDVFDTQSWDKCKKCLGEILKSAKLNQQNF